MDLHLKQVSRACRSLGGVEQQVVYGTFRIPRIDVGFRRRKLADCAGHALPVQMKLHCRNGPLNNQGNALMIRPSVTTELQ